MKNKTPKMYLGIDWGAKKIGLAFGDDFTKTAVPFKVVKNLAEVKAIVKKEKIDRIILGEPRSLSGKLNIKAKEFNKFLENLKRAESVPVELVDERLTSKLADNLRRQAGNKQAQRGVADQDAVAAMLILEAYFLKTKN